MKKILIAILIGIVCLLTYIVFHDAQSKKQNEIQKLLSENAHAPHESFPHSQ